MRIVTQMSVMKFHSNFARLDNYLELDHSGKSVRTTKPTNHWENLKFFE